MESEIVICLVVLVTIAAHIAIYSWVKFKIHEGVILRFLREDLAEGASHHHASDVIAARTDISVARVKVVCRKSVEIYADSMDEINWRAR